MTLQESILCLKCLYRLPVTGFHLQRENPVTDVFRGRVRLESAAAYLFFNKGGKIQDLMHALKYRGQQDIGICLGIHFGLLLALSPWFRSVDLIIPVPLHPVKLRKRGFNQSLVISQGIAEGLKRPVAGDHLLKVRNTGSQTKRSRYGRWENVRDAFRVVGTSSLKGKHILLVDDVLTTGATLESCTEKLLEIAEVKVSVATIAYAQD